MRYLKTMILVLTLLMAGCTSEKKNKAVDTSVLQVRLAKVELKTYQLPVHVTGILGASTEAKLGFKTGGIVRKLNVKEGATVERGAILMELDLSEINALVNQAQIGLDKAKRDLSRASNLYRDSVTTLEQLQNARSALELAQAQKQIADFNKQHSRITAPTAGRIQKILVERNEFIAPGYPALLFASTEGDWVVRVALTDKDIVKFSPGDSALVEMDPFPEISFPARITELGAIADPLTGTYEAELTLLQKNPQFRSGFIARASIFPTHPITAALVPLEALLEASDNSATVYVYRDGEVSRRSIRTGRLVGDMMMVLEGVQPGELVVTEGARYILKDSRVRPVNLDKMDDQ